MLSAWHDTIVAGVCVASLQPSATKIWKKLKLLKSRAKLDISHKFLVMDVLSAMFEFSEILCQTFPYFSGINWPASMAVVDAKPDAASLLSALGKRPGQICFKIWHWYDLELHWKILISHVPDDTIDAVEAWDRVGEGGGGCGQVVDPNSLASTSSRLVVVVRRDRVSWWGCWAGNRTRTSRGGGGKNGRTIEFWRPTGRWDAGRQLDLGMGAPPSVIPCLGRPVSKSRDVSRTYFSWQKLNLDFLWKRFWPYFLKCCS